MIKFPFVKHNKGDHPVFEYDQIDEHIFIGTNRCCQVHFDKRLIEAGISADISMEAERVDAPFGLKFFCWLPTEDHTPPTQEQLHTGVDFISSLINQNQKMYVHCKNGHGRAPTLVSAYYISKGLSVEEAIKKIQAERKVIHLDADQIQALVEFAKRK
jgi:protein-tyrosine phosphatase